MIYVEFEAIERVREYFQKTFLKININPCVFEGISNWYYDYSCLFPCNIKLLILVWILIYCNISTLHK